MICSKCNNDGVLNTVLGKDFYYCRTCKDEIVLQEVSKPNYLLNLSGVTTGRVGVAGLPPQSFPSHMWSSSTGYCSNCGAHFTSTAASSSCSPVVAPPVGRPVQSHAWYPGLDFRGDPANICQDCGADSKGLYPTYCPGPTNVAVNPSSYAPTLCNDPNCRCQQLPKDPYP